MDNSSGISNKYAFLNRLATTPGSFTDTLVTGSGLKGCVEIAIKILLFPKDSDQLEKDFKENHYFNYVINKSFGESLLLALPFINIPTALIIYYTGSGKKSMIESVEKNGLSLQFASKALKNDEVVVLAAVKNNPEAGKFMGSDIEKEYRFYEKDCPDRWTSIKICKSGFAK